MEMVKIWLNVLIFMQYLLNIRSEVSADFERCRNKFYQLTPPYLNGLTNSIQICQKHKNLAYQFATNYNTALRIPYYSAYIIDSFFGTAQRKGQWFVEPQLVKPNDEETFLVFDNSINGQPNKQNPYKQSQQIKADYFKSGYTRGHLNPNGYNKLSSETRSVTNSLTNIAPQAEAFNNGIWQTLENSLYDAMNKSCSFDGARRYFITGVIPSNGKTIPNGRVNVPNYFWTAACCDSSAANNADERMKGWSAAFLGENIAKSSIHVYKIETFLKFLAGQTSSKNPQLFADYFDGATNVKNCLFNQNQAKTAVGSIFENKGFIDKL